MKFRFLKMMGYETKRIFRNKTIFVMLLIFAVAMIVFLFFLQSADMEYVIAVYAEGIENPAEEQAIRITERDLHAEIRYVESDEAGISLLKNKKAILYIRMQKEEEGTRATFYYDASDRIVKGFIESFKNATIDQTYNALIEWLGDWGITMDRAYFERITFSPLFTKLTLKQLSFVSEIAVFVSLILLLGVAYSLARDRETDVAKNLCYTPIGYNTYFLSKLVPYFILGMAEMLFLCVLGAKLLKISFQINLFAVWGLSALFVSAILSLGMLVSMMRSQISAVFVGMATILLPFFVELIVITSALPLGARVFLDLMPITPFMQLLNGMIYNGVILWKNLPILAAQTVGYYLLSLVVIKRQTA